MAQVFDVFSKYFFLKKPCFCSNYYTVLGLFFDFLQVYLKTKKKKKEETNQLLYCIILFSWLPLSKNVLSANS